MNEIKLWGVRNEPTCNEEFEGCERDGRRDGGRVWFARTRGPGAVGVALPAGLLLGCVEGQRGKRASRLQRFAWGLALLVAFSFVLAPRVAFASSWDTWLGVIQKQSVIDSELNESMWGFVVGAGNPYDAAAYACGLTRSEIAAIDLVMRAKLSNPETGRNFYELALVFGNGHITGPGSNIPFWSSTDFIGQLWTVTQGQPPIYVATVSKSFLTAAKRDLDTVLSGGSLGGGGSGGGEEVTEYYTFEVRTRYVTSNSSYMLRYEDSNGNRYTNRLGLDSDINLLPSILYVRIPKNKINLADGMTLAYINLIGSSGTGFRKNIIWQLGASLKNTVTVADSTYSYTYNGETHNNIPLYGSCTYSDYPIYANSPGQDCSFTIDGDVLTLEPTDVKSMINLTAGSSYNLPYVQSVSSGHTRGKYNGLSSNTSVGPNNWPDTPQNPTPDPPEVPTPEPPTPTVDPTPPIDPTPPQNPIIPTTPIPDPPTPITPIVVTEPTNTSPTDYTPWLRAILQQLRNIATSLGDGFNMIGTALDDHCIHLQNALGSWMQWLERSIAVIVNNARLSLQSYLDYLFEELAVNVGDEIADAIYHLELYLKEQMEWLAEQFDFSFTGYDDSSVVSWLRQIYSKLEFGTWHNPVGRPTDKDIENGFDWWSWLIDTLVKLLGDGAADTIDTLVGILEEMQRLFPFSIPWDLAAVFAALVAAPLTPVFDVTIPAISGWWDAVVFHVDLSPYDNAAEVVRMMWVVWFTVVLIMRTDWLVGVFETGARVVTQFLDRL